MRLSSIKLTVGLLSILLFTNTLLANPLDSNTNREDLNHRFTKLEELLENSSDYQTYVLLDTAARTALELGYYKKAYQLATKLLRIAGMYSNDWNYGTALHHAHIVLGKVALAHNDIKTAKRQLLAAGAVPSSETLAKNGPDLRLANDLLKKNEVTIVASYLQLCRKFWGPGKHKLNGWLIQLGKGEKPDLFIDIGSRPQASGFSKTEKKHPGD